VAINTISVCAGVGMLDTAFGIIGGFRTVCYIEREAYAASRLVALMEAGCLDAAPVWSDLGTFDGRPWRGKVDCIAGGLPCQPYSVAGKRIGNDDHRSWGVGDGPIPNFLRIVSEVRPALVFIENVPAFVTGGFFRPVGEELSAMGYRIERPIFVAAEDVGASHRRERVFILAHRLDDAGRTERRSNTITGGSCSERRDGERQAASRIGESIEELADARSAGRQQIPGSISPHAGIQTGADRRGGGNDQQSTGEGAGLAHSGHERVRRSAGCDETTGGRAFAEIAGSGALMALGIFAPGPIDPRWPRIITDYPHLEPATQPGVRGVADGFTWLVDESRRHQLRAIGNGCVPLAVSLAFVTLADEAGIELG